MSITKRYINSSVLLTEDPRGPISTKFGIAGCLADLVTRLNFFGNRLSGFNSAIGHILLFSYLQHACRR